MKNKIMLTTMKRALFNLEEGGPDMLGNDRVVCTISAQLISSAVLMLFFYRFLRISREPEGK